MKAAAFFILVLVVLQRLAELVYAARNTRRLRARGAVEIGRAHYPLIVLLHAAWLAAIAAALATTSAPVIHITPLLLFLALQGLRVWVIASLGPYWTTRIISLPNAPLMRSGPYRFFKHPNYLVVVGEIAMLPQVFGFTNIAIVFSVLNASALFWRIRVENAALAARA